MYYCDFVMLFLPFIFSAYDLTIGGLELSSPWPAASFIPYDYDDKTWCFAKLAPYPLLVNIFRIFTPEAWCLHIATVTLVTFIWFSLFRYEGVYWDIKRYWSVTLFTLMGAPMTFRPRNDFVRLVMGVHFVAGFLWNIVFVSLWMWAFSNMCTNIQPKTVAAAAKGGYRFAGAYNTWNIWSAQDKDIWPIKFNPVQDGEIDMLLEQLNYDRKLALATSRAHALNNQAIHRSRIFCFPPPKSIYGYSVVIYSHNQFHYLPETKVIIQDFVEFGFVKKWTMDNTNGHRKNAKTFSYHFFLTFDSVQALLMQMAAGLLGSLVLFVLECVTFWRNTRKRGQHMIWRLLDAFFNHRRYVHLEKPPFFRNSDEKKF